MATVAATATTIRRDDGKYYTSLWLIFCFIMALAQLANIGHAISGVSGKLPELHLPVGFPDKIVYVFAGAFAALFPLGGTLLVHVSGFLRAHGVGQDWIDQDAEEVLTDDAGSGAPRKPRERRQEAPPPPPPPDTEDDDRAEDDADDEVPAATLDPWWAKGGPDARRAREDAYQAWLASLSTKAPQNATDVAAALGGITPGAARKVISDRFKRRAAPDLVVNAVRTALELQQERDADPAPENPDAEDGTGAPPDLAGTIAAEHDEVLPDRPEEDLEAESAGAPVVRLRQRA